MTTPRLVSLLLLSTALVAPASAFAQDAVAPATGADAPAPASIEAPADAVPDADAPTDATATEAEAPDVSMPGGDIIVTGKRTLNVQRAAPQVVSVLSTEEIARTGEGDIAGALGRVTGLSVVGNGYVYVRGLGDRYSLALLNGSPLPSPEPLKRVIPLDLFPTSIVASSLVQKSYSANFPGEFGGGVINLTTKAIPKENFLSFGGGIGYDSETTGKLSYTYYGSRTDWTGYDNGNRSLPDALKTYFNGDTVINPNSAQAREIGSQLFNSRNAVVQKDTKTQPNFSFDLSGGAVTDVRGARLGLIAAAGYSNKTQTRDIIQQRAQGLTADPSSFYENFRTVASDNRVVANGLLGVGLEIGDNKIRWTNVYIHDTDKHTNLRFGQKGSNLQTDFMIQNTAWYERQLIDTQLVGEFKLGPDTSLDLRAGYANSRRDAPFEIEAEYQRSNVAGDPFGNYFVNRLGNGSSDPTTITFSKLDEDVWSAGADLSHRFGPGWSSTVGYAYQLNSRINIRRSFSIYATGDANLVSAFGLLRPDLLFQPAVWNANSQGGVNYSLELREPDAATARFDARLLNHAWYAKVDGTITDALSFDAGVRWEWANESTILRPVGGTPTSIPPLKNEYWLPAVTLTYEIEPSMQLRASASKTIARPQFRELLFQPFYDPDTNRTYQGNPFLVDSQLYNAEARYEWYFGRDQRFALGGFWKKIDKPIETFLTGAESFITSYANAPSAQLYGAEVEVQKYVPLFDTRRLVLVGNYTWTKSRLKVGAGDTLRIFGAGTTTSLASDYFRDGAPLTGQSEHIANLQLGMEDTDNLSQQTLLISYASKRAVSRGLNNTGQPDVVENPGLNIDVVLRQGVKLSGRQMELKLEARNLTGRGHNEYQMMDDGRVDVNTYDLGRTVSFSASIQF